MLTFGTEMLPAVTVSVALRRVSCQLFPMTGSTPTPVAKVILLVRPPSTKVELFDGSNWTWFEHGAPHMVPTQSNLSKLTEFVPEAYALANSSVWLPVSKTTVIG